MFLVAYGLSLSVSFSFTKGILLIKKRISCIGYQKKLIPNSCGGNLLCILILYLPSSTAVGGCLFRRRRTLFDTISIPLLKLVVPPVEIDVKHDHRAGRQATEQKPVTMGKVVMNWHDRTHTHKKLQMNLLLIVGECQWPDAAITGWECIQQRQVERPPNFDYASVASRK